MARIRDMIVKETTAGTLGKWPEIVLPAESTSRRVEGGKTYLWTDFGNRCDRDC